jgi:hypothetical protein
VNPLNSRRSNSPGAAIPSFLVSRLSFQHPSYYAVPPINASSCLT